MQKRRFDDVRHHFSYCAFTPIPDITLPVLTVVADKLNLKEYSVILTAVFLWHKSEDINKQSKKAYLQNFSWLQTILRLQVNV